MKKDEREALKENDLYEKSIPILKWLEKNSKVLAAGAFLFILLIVVIMFIVNKSDKDDFTKKYDFQKAKLTKSQIERADKMTDEIDKLTKDEDKANALLSIGDARLSKDEVLKAKEAYQKIIDNYPNTTCAPYALSRLAGVYSSYKIDDKIDYQKAIELYKKVLNNPDLKNTKEIEELIKLCEEAASKQSLASSTDKNGDKVSDK